MSLTSQSEPRKDLQLEPDEDAAAMRIETDRSGRRVPFRRMGSERSRTLSFGIDAESGSERGSYTALPSIPEDTEEEEWYIQFDGIAATRPGSGESQDAPKMLVGDPDHEPPQRTMAEEQEDRRQHRREQERWDQIWMKRAREKDWYQVQAPLEAYR